MSTAVIESTAATSAAASPAAAHGALEAMRNVNEYLTFRLGAEEYGIDILRVQEIRSYEQPTRMANSPAFIRGIINLRGVIVPIVDMRMKFNLGDSSFGDSTVTIVQSLGTRVVGMVVDSVSDVVTLAGSQMRPVPELTSVVDAEHIHAIGVVDDRMLILVDIIKLMASPEMGLH